MDRAQREVVLVQQRIGGEVLRRVRGIERYAFRERRPRLEPGILPNSHRQ